MYASTVILEVLAKFAKDPRRTEIILQCHSKADLKVALERYSAYYMRDNKISPRIRGMVQDRLWKVYRVVQRIDSNQFHSTKGGLV